MTLTATEIYDRLTELDSDDEQDFALDGDTTESDVEAWLDGIDVDGLEADADDAIDRTAVTDLTTSQGIGPDDLSVADVIDSRNDDPSDYDAAYIVRADRTFVQYFKPGIGGKEPIPEEEVDTWLADHVAEMVERVVAGELMDRARAEFGK